VGGLAGGGGGRGVVGLTPPFNREMKS